MKLDVGPAAAGGIDESARLDHVRRKQAGAEQRPLRAMPQCLHALVEFCPISGQSQMTGMPSLRSPFLEHNFTPPSGKALSQSNFAPSGT